MASHPQVPYAAWDPGNGPVEAAHAFHDVLAGRRSVRNFSSRPVPREAIEWIVRTAGTAPSGANKQPWRFVAVSDPELKRQIREGAEAEERLFYGRRASADWLRDLEALGTGPEKPFLEEAPWLLVVFKVMKDERDGAPSSLVYYANESVGIAVGFLLAAIHHAGLASLTHTPSPMQFLGRILKRPDSERPFLLIPVGHPAEGCVVPDIRRKELGEILVFDAPGA